VIYDVLMVVLRVLGAVVAAVVLAFGFAFLIFLGEANARGRALVSRGFDRLAMLIVYLSWFAPLWWFGFSELLLMAGCAATAVLCVIYAASYQTTMSRRPFDVAPKPATPH
jgi:hypothetical protein